MKDDYMVLHINNKKISVVGSVLTTIPFKDIKDELIFDERPRTGKEGDILLAKVSDKNENRDIKIQNFQGRPVNIYPEDLIVGVLGTRQSTTHLVGKLPDHPLEKNSKINLLSEGGIMGIATYTPEFMGKPVILEVSGFFNYKSKILNISDFRQPSVEARQLPPIFLICGTSSNTGKTTLARNMINILSRKYKLRICSIIMSGTGSKDDALVHRSAGAACIHSFIEAGFCNTYNCSEKEFLPALKNLLYKITSEEQPQLIIGELGGDFMWGHNDNILRDSSIMGSTLLIIVVVNDLLSAVGTKKMFRKWNIKTPVVFANSLMRSFGGMSLRFSRLLEESLINITDRKDLESFIEQIRKKDCKINNILQDNLLCQCL